MLDERHRRLVDQGDRLFNAKRQFDTLCEDMAMLFYPEMGGFTTPYQLGDDVYSDLMSSFPVMVRRSLGDAIGAMLRPANLDTTSPGVWFSIKTADESLNKGIEERRYLEWATMVQRRAMYDPRAAGPTTLKMADHSFVTFGQAPISLNVSADRSRLIFQSKHLRDMAWSDDANGVTDLFYEKSTKTALQLCQLFPKTVHPAVRDLIVDEPEKEVKCLHIVCAVSNYEARKLDGRKWRKPWVSIWVDVENMHLLQEVESATSTYIIPRWQRIPGCQYAMSPSAICGCSDARLIQAITRTILEASEKFADPPMAATQEAIRSDVSLFAGGITWVDSEYDERMGDALKPLFQPTHGQSLASAFQLEQATRDSLSKAFYLDSLSLPPIDGSREMTATEVNERTSEWIRRAMPVFEAIEYDYNAPLCEQVFELMMDNGAFGPPEMMPESLRRAEVKFMFESPLHQASERRYAQTLAEAQNLLLNSAQIDPSVVPMMKTDLALTEAWRGMGVPADWVRSAMERKRMAAAQQEEKQSQQMLMGMATAAQAGKDMAGAAKAYADASAPSGGGGEPQ